MTYFYADIIIFPSSAVLFFYGNHIFSLHRMITNKYDVRRETK